MVASSPQKNFVVNSSWWCDEPTDIPNPVFKRKHFSDPAQFKGYMHPDWNIYKPLQMKDYLHLHNMVNLDLEDCGNDAWKSSVKLFIMLSSNPNPGGETSRNRARNTWMNWTKVIQNIEWARAC